MPSPVTSRGTFTRYRLQRSDEATKRSPTSGDWSRGGQALHPLFGAARTLIEGQRSDSVELLTTMMRKPADPEALYYFARHFAHLDQTALALDALAKAIGGGHFCFASLADDSWFDSVRREPEFQALLNLACQQRDSAAAAFRDAGGATLLGEHTVIPGEAR